MTCEPVPSPQSSPVRASPKTLLAWVPAGAIAVAIFLLSSLPASALPPTQWLSLDKLAHAAVYGAFAAAVARGLHSRSPRSSRASVRSLVVAALVSLTYGALDELHQTRTPGRCASAADVVADGIGALLGTMWFAARIKHRGPHAAQ